MSFTSAVSGAPRLTAPRLGSLSTSDEVVVHAAPSLGGNTINTIGKSRMFSNAVKATLLSSSTSVNNSDTLLFQPKLFQPSRSAQSQNVPPSAAVVAAEAASISAARHVADITEHKHVSPIHMQQSAGVDLRRTLNTHRVMPQHHFQTLQPPNLSSGAQHSQTALLLQADVMDQKTSTSKTNIVPDVTPVTTTLSKAATITKASPPMRHLRAGMTSLALPLPSLNSSTTQSDNSLESGDKPISLHGSRFELVPLNNIRDHTTVVNVPSVSTNLARPGTEGVPKVLIKTLSAAPMPVSPLSPKEVQVTPFVPKEAKAAPLAEDKASLVDENYSKFNKEDDLLESLRSSIQLTNELLNHQQRPMQTFQTLKKEKDAIINRRSESVFSMLLDSGGLDEPRSNESIRSKPVNRTPGTIKISFIEEDATQSGSGQKNQGMSSSRQAYNSSSEEEDNLPSLSVLVNNERKRKEQANQQRHDTKATYLDDGTNEKDVVAETAERLLTKAAELRSKRHSITSTNTESSSNILLHDSRSKVSSSTSGSRRQSNFGVRQGYIGIDVDSGSDQLLSAGPLITVTPPKVDAPEQTQKNNDIFDNDRNGSRYQRRQSTQSKSRRATTTRSQLEANEVNSLANKILELASPHNSKMVKKLNSASNQEEGEERSLIRTNKRYDDQGGSYHLSNEEYDERVSNDSDAQLAARLEELLSEGANVEELSATIAADLHRSNRVEVDQVHDHQLIAASKSTLLSNTMMESAVAQVLSTQAQTATLISQQTEQFSRLMELQRVQSEQQAQILSMIASVASSTRSSLPGQSRAKSPDPIVTHSPLIQQVDAYARGSSHNVQGTPHRILSPVSAFESRSHLARAALVEKASIDAAAASKMSTLEALVSDSSNLYLAKDRLAAHARFHEERNQRRSPSPPKLISVVPAKSNPTVRITTVSPDVELPYSPTLSERLEQARVQDRLSNEYFTTDARLKVPESRQVIPSSLTARQFSSAVSSFRRADEDLVPIPSIFTFIPSFSHNVAHSSQHSSQRDDTLVPSQVVSMMPQPFLTSSIRPNSAGRSRANSTTSAPLIAERQSSQPRTYAELMKLKGVQTPVAPLRRSISIGRNSRR